MPKVSVIVPVYNVEKYLHECLDSVINQTLKDIEIICINDGSTDNSLKILREYEKKDNRIIVFNQKNKGGGAARNVGLAHAKGEFLAFLDGDDFYQDDFIEKMYTKAIETGSNIVVCAANGYNTINKESLFLSYSLRADLLPSKEIFNYKDIPNYIFNFGQNWNWNKIFNRQFIIDNKITFQEIYRTNDLLFTCKELVLANKITTIKESLVNYRIAQNTNCQSTNHLYPLDFYKAFKELRNFLIKVGKYTEVERSYLSWCIGGCVYNINSVKDKKIKALIVKTITRNLKKLGLENYKKLDAEHYNRLKDFKYLLKHKSNTFLETVFSVKNNKNKTHKVVTILGLKIKRKRKRK